MAFAFDGSACPAEILGWASALTFKWFACGVGESCHSIQQARWLSAGGVGVEGGAGSACSASSGGGEVGVKVNGNHDIPA